VFKSLEALIPPKELSIPFNVNFYQLQKQKAFGEVETAYFNDYDYKVFAKYNSKNLTVELTVTRNELDLKKIKKEFAYIFKNAKQPYDLKTLEKKEFKISKTANEILKWENNIYNESALKKLGDFSFSYYFLKNQTSQKEDYPYKDVSSKERKEIIDKFGGIKIYRDSFRVRPYGDTGNDWLKLGERAVVSPAGPGQRIGDWRVRPNQIAGLITISRIENPNLLDKSDRGGLQENETFDTLQKLLKAMIYEFELDRTKILNPFYEDAQIRKVKEREDEIRKEAEKLADKIVLERQKVDQKVLGIKPNLFTSKKEQEEKKSYERLISKSLEKFDKKDDENAEIAQIRTLASLGLIVSSFAHELKEAKNNFNDILKIEKLFNKVITDDKKKSIDYKDIVDIIELLKAENEKISHWVEYSLTAIKKDKRKRGAIKFDKFFVSLNKSWKTVLENRNVELEIKNSITKPYIFRAFEMDMNTVFNNLISNSIDAFHNLKTIRERKISITFSLIKGNIQIVYADNGTGIPNVFKKNKDEIFLPFTTSKKDRDGNDIGTGLGMYLVKNVITDNNGTVELMDTAIGFKLKIELPTRNK
jgi:signal transduction histidine kinase